MLLAFAEFLQYRRMRIHFPSHSFLAAGLLTLFLGSASEIRADLHATLRDGDTASLKKLLAAKADPNGVDNLGLTPLMYAAAYGSLEDMRQLLAAGASANAQSPLGATALLFAAHDPEKTKLLLQSGAKVNLAAKNGATALLVAAINENERSLRLLWDAAANPDLDLQLLPALPFRLGLNRLAFATNDGMLRAFLKEVAYPTPSPEQLKTLAIHTPLTNLFMMSGFSLRRHRQFGFADGLSALLSLGANPNGEERQLQRRISPLSVAALHGDLASAKLLLDAGANPNYAGSNGFTPLMAAASGEDPNLELLQLLVQRGANPQAKDLSGRSALDWALKLGKSPLSDWLLRQGVPNSTKPVSSAFPLANAKNPRQALIAALAPLRQAGPAFQEKARCISCHHQSLPSVALRIAASKRLEVDSATLQHSTAATLKTWEPSREDFLMGNCSIAGFLGNVSYGLFAMAEEDAPANPITDAAAHCLASLQWPDGRWEGGDMRPPLAGKLPLVYTALAIRGIAKYAPPAARERSQRQVRKAVDFLLTSDPSDTQGEAFRLLGMLWGNAPQTKIEGQMKRMLSLQNKDGGWAQRPGMSSDAYASGQALFAIRKAGAPPSQAAYRRGVEFLLRTQLADGTWFVESRAHGFQPYIDTGFPHGRNQFISAAATAWAAAALGLGL